MGPACPRCGSPLESDAPAGLCPSCLFRTAAEDSHSRSQLSDVDRGPAAEFDGPSLRSGQRFGPYLIERVLGRGGMGDVYAAQHIEHGRRVAIKLLGRRLTGPEDRQRFLKEGELAAAVNHPNTVYVFGSEEIDDTPTIAMELLPGGTLKDRVKQHGVLRTTEAVDAILQVISGLEAAHSCGVLHRDVKPSNCFIDVDGTVKVGDFGLSIPATPDPNPAAGFAAFHGTPGFAPPEQLRGEPLDIRADIYAVGATLYYLLTGEAPGGRRGLSALAAGLESKPIRALTEFRSDIHRPLGALIVRCLSPQQALRPNSYADLADALRPFGSAQAPPAPVGLRFAARLFDVLILFPIVAIFLGTLVGSRLVSGEAPALLLGLLAPAALYWLVAEGVLGFTLGKRICGVMVVGPAGQPAGTFRAAIRTAVWIAPFALPLAFRALGASTPTIGISLAILGSALIIPMTFHWQFRGLHDRLSGTHVVLRRRPTAMQAPNGQTRLVPAGAEQLVVGPYEVLASIGTTDMGELLLGFDPRLRRDVWLHVQQLGEVSRPDVPHDIARSARLRWLSGRRTDRECWDAYEVPTGRSLFRLESPVPWSAARRILLDLSRELDAATSDHSIGELSLTRVWLTDDNHAKLLDFSAPGSGPAAPAVSSISFLRDVASHLFHGVSPTSVPFGASLTRQALNRGEISTPAQLAIVLSASADGLDRVTRRQRGMALAAGVLACTVAAGWIGALVAVAMSPVIDLRSVSPQLIRVVAAFFYVCLGLACAAFWRGGFWLRSFGIAVVTADGAAVSRGRAILRAAIVWGSVPVAAVASLIGFPLLAVALGICQFVFILYAIDHPAQGLHDRLAGTYLVPR
jgi:uncharacterized RDD family membrane protein YckC